MRLNGDGNDDDDDGDNIIESIAHGSLITLHFQEGGAPAK